MIGCSRCTARYQLPLTEQGCKCRPLPSKCSCGANFRLWLPKNNNKVTCRLRGTTWPAGNNAGDMLSSVVSTLGRSNVSRTVTFLLNLSSINTRRVQLNAWKIEKTVWCTFTCHPKMTRLFRANCLWKSPRIFILALLASEIFSNQA